MITLSTKTEEINFHTYDLSIDGEDESYNFSTTTANLVEVLIRLNNKVAGRDITGIKSLPGEPDYEKRVLSLKASPLGDYGGCHVCGRFDIFNYCCFGDFLVDVLICTKHRIYTVIQSGRYSGHDIDRELLCITGVDISKAMMEM